MKFKVFQFILILFFITVIKSCSTINKKTNETELASFEKDNNIREFNKHETNSIHEIMKAKYEAGNYSDSILISNFNDFHSLLPDLKLPYTFGNDNFPKINDTIACFIHRTNYNHESGMPIAKFKAKEFIGIIFSLPSEGISLDLVTFNLEGKKINSINIYRIDGYFRNSPKYNKEEKCIGKIDMDYKVHFKHDSSKYIKFKNIETDQDHLDTIYEDDYEERFYIINKNGYIKKLKQ